MPNPRAELARRAADSLLRAGPAIVASPALVGFDAFIDSIIHVVDQRASMAADDFSRIRTIEQYSKRVAAAAGKSTNMEMVVVEDRFGGNGPLIAGSLAQIGVPTTYLGGVGREDDPSRLHAVYAPFAERCERSGGRVVPLSPPAHTDALEFEDGKIMLGKPANLQSITWSLLVGTFGLGTIRQLLAQSRLLAIVNWVMMGGVEGIWHGLCDEVFSAPPPPGLSAVGAWPRVFIDLADPAKRTSGDIARGIAALTRMNTLTPVTLGLNLSEAQRIAAVCDSQPPPSDSASGAQLQAFARRLQATLALDCVVIHPRHGAAAATSQGDSGWFDGPFVARPKLSTGAGDHFNAGFALGQILSLPLDQCLAIGCANSGAYVRDAESPTLDRLVEFLGELPMPEPA